MLLDSNIIIYAVLPEHQNIRDYIATIDPSVSAISLVEVLGYHQISAPDRVFFEDFFREIRVLPVSEVVISHATRLRQQRNISLGDSIIAATALAHGLELATHNVADFDWINGLSVFDPIS